MTKKLPEGWHRERDPNTGRLVNVPPNRTWFTKDLRCAEGCILAQYHEGNCWTKGNPWTEPVAKDSHSELPLLTKEQAAEGLKKLMNPGDTLYEMMVENAESHDAHIKEHIERMRGTEALHVDLCNAPLDGIGDIIHLDMDPYLVKLRSLHASLQRMVADGHYVTPSVAAMLDALETDP